MSPFTNRIHKEIYSISRHPPQDFTCRTKFDDFSLEIIFNGADGTFYENGTFILELIVPRNYPFQTPKLQFMTPIYHPNVDVAGRICLDMLLGRWCPTNRLYDLLETVKYLIYHPNVDDPLIPERAIEYKYDIEEFKRKAREWTHVFAPKIDMNALKPKIDYFMWIGDCSLEGRGDLNKKSEGIISGTIEEEEEEMAISVWDTADNA
ncbi:hypothetical protein PGB90_005330 [Kerria lacca]